MSLVTRSLHFPTEETPRRNGTVETPKPARKQKESPPENAAESAPTVRPTLPNAMDALRGAGVQISVLADKYKSLVPSRGRHGDLLVMRSACEHLFKYLDILIEHEDLAS